MKNSTNSLSQLTIGLDLGNTISDYCLIEGKSNVIREGQVGSTKTALTKLFSLYPGALVVCESSSHSRWIQMLVRDMPLRIIVANSRELALINQSQRKNDKRDAYVLANVGACMPDMLRPVIHKEDAFYVDLAVLESRNTLTATRTGLINRIKGLCKAQGEPLKIRGGQAFHKKVEELIPKSLRNSIYPLLKVLESINDQISAIDKNLDEMEARYPVVTKLRTIHGVGIQTALTFFLTVCDPSRFSNNRDVGAYLGLVPRQRSSGSSNPQLGITKAGSNDLRRLLVLCSHYILNRGQDCSLQRWGLSLCERGGKNAKKRACVAVARKLSVLMLALWKSSEAYDPMRNLEKAKVA